MTKEQVRQALDRVLTWPPERQADVVEMLQAIEGQDGSDYHLTDEQAAEVQRRLDETNPETLTFEEWDRHLRDWTERLEQLGE